MSREREFWGLVWGRGGLCVVGGNGLVYHNMSSQNLKANEPGNQR